MNKNELFRRVNARSPQIVDRLITLWGGPDLCNYINDLLAGSDATLELTEGITFALSSLKAIHGSEFPQFGSPPVLDELGVLAGSPEFSLVSSKFPRIGKQILSTWGHATFCDYVNELMNDRRDGHRQGFPEDVMMALFRLMQQHDKEFPQFVLKVTDIWTLANKM